LELFGNISNCQVIAFGNAENGCFWHYQNADNQYRYNRKTAPNSTGKEKDPLRLYLQSGELCRARLTSPPDLLTGYSYFDARYLEHELMTMWLSVDPMADKYPSISPYAYCAWNPVRLVDPDGEKIRGVKYNSETQQFSYSRRAIRRGTKRYIDARIKTENGRKGVLALVNSKRKFTIKVTDKPLFAVNKDKTYSQLGGITIEDVYGLNTTIIVSTAEKIQISTVGYVVSDQRYVAKRFVEYRDISSRLSTKMEDVFNETNLYDFEANHPYESVEQRIHGIGAHEEEHALRPIDDEQQEEYNAQMAEMRERLEYIKEVENE